ncbi:MAG: DUF1194 domain-containing protein [Pseudomonadota bacterium]
MRRRSLIAAAGISASFAVRAQSSDPVDVALVLAVDVSRSIDPDEAVLQREGYRNAITDARVLEAIRAGMMGGVAIAYVEWAGIEYQRLVLPWMRIGSAADAQRWAEALAEAPRVSLSWTSISGAIEMSRRVLADCPFEATRRVIDVSGDGVNNSGPPAEVARDGAVADGIIINGLPIINDRPTFGRMPPVPLDTYYRDSVIGGAGSFMEVAVDFESFGTAVKRKLIREIA